MKIDRLIGIITILLQNDKVTIAQLAERHEVSCRTIQRDIDAICRAGIPIVSMQGYQGGLSIASGYKLDKTVFTQKEWQAILTGIKSIDSVSKTAYGQTLIEKFHNCKDAVIAEHDMILIDLASWYQTSLSEKIEDIKNAILNRNIITFEYYSDKGESERAIEPYLIVYKWSSWYVYGFCLDQNDYRLFKLNRAWKIQIQTACYSPRIIPEGKINFENFSRVENIKLTAIFDSSMKYRLIDEYGPDCFNVDESGRLLFHRSFSNQEYVLQWLLSFGDKVQVLEPPILAMIICEQAKNLLEKYK